MEASLPPGDVSYPYHLAPDVCADIARRRGASTLLLTHIPPHRDRSGALEAASSRFPGEVAAVEPGNTYEIKEKR